MVASRVSAAHHLGRTALTVDERGWLVDFAQRVGFSDAAKEIDIDLRTLHRLAAGAGGMRGSIALVRNAMARERNKK